MEQPRTLFEMFLNTAGKYPKNVVLGYKENGYYKKIRYIELLGKVNRCVSFLIKLGIKKDDKFAIFSGNNMGWVILDLALNKIGAVSVPIHTTLSPRLIKYIINHSGSKYLAIGDLFSKYQDIEKEVSLKRVITFNEIEWRKDLVYFWDLLKEEKDDKDFIISEIATIVYTSGTTGEPKGVILSNANIISNVISASQYVPYNKDDVFLSFLPLSHVLERTGGYYAPLYFGSSIFFAASPKTLAEDIKKVKPTILVSVPRVFERVYDKIMDRIRLKSKFQQKLFFNSLNISRACLAHSKNNLVKFFLYLLADRFILKKVRSSLGGRLRFCISGGASLNPSMAKFFEAIGIKILEGYGLTETSPIISVNPLNNYKFGTVGKIIPGAEVKIMADKEIWVKGPGVTRGYYNNEENKENVSNGWFKTGDLGYLDKSGYLTIIGRKKEMIITSTGKNINPVDLENALQESKYVNQAMVYGDKEKYIKALIVPDFEELKIFSSNNELDNLEIFDLIKEEKILNLYRNEINNQLKEFADYEQVGEFKILDREFSEEKEELTPTLKLRRKKIIENFYEKRDR